LKDVRGRLGEALKAWRMGQRLTQEQLAERSGLSYKFIGEIERGRANPTVDTLARLADALGIGVAELFAGGDHPHRAGHEAQMSRRELQALREALSSIVTLAESVSRQSTRRKSIGRRRPPSR
jgi:transcriptional regulator with XRE-family HTH domain